MQNPTQKHWSKSYPPPKTTLPKVLLTDVLAEHTANLLDSFARQAPSEGVVYWFGLENEKQAIVTTLVVPKADTTGGSIRTSAQVNAQAVSAVIGTPLVLLGQAHSHPSANVAHSPIDDRDTFARFEGGLSVVVPYFGRYGLHLDACGIYRFVDGKYHSLQSQILADHLIILPGCCDFRPQTEGIPNGNFTTIHA